LVLKYNYPFCISLEICIASTIAVLTFLGAYELVSVLFAVSFLVIIGLAFTYTYRRNVINLAGLMTILCFFNIVINGLTHGGIFSFHYFKKMITACSFVFLMYYTCHNVVTVPEKTVGLIKNIPVILVPVSVVSYYLLSNVQMKAGGITMGFSNPNFAGMWLLHIFLYGMLFVMESFSSGKRGNLIIFPILLLLLNMIFLTRARSCLVGVAFFFLMLPFKSFVCRHNKLFAVIVSLFPIVFALIYLLTVNSHLVRSIFDFLLSTGKTLNSRVGIWTNAFNMFYESPVFGNYAGISDGTGMSQMHNTHVDFLCSYGLIPFAFFIKILYDCLASVGKKVESFSNYAALCAFYSVIVVGSFEAATLSGAMGLNLLTTGFLTMAIYKKASNVG